ncbi:MAG: restriction endonuclease subunit S [Kiritimatiellia bacterium]
MSVSAQSVIVVRFKDLDKWQIPRAGLVPATLPKGWRVARVGDLVRQVTDRVRVASDKAYKMLGVRWYGEGAFLRETVQGDAMSAAWVTPAMSGAFIYNRLFAWKESFAVVPPEFDGCFVSGEFPQFIPDPAQVSAEYLDLLFRLPSIIRAVNAASAGSAAVSRNRFKEVEFLRMELPIPPLETQRAILAEWRKAKTKIAAAENKIPQIEENTEEQFFADLGFTPPAKVKPLKYFAARWRDFPRWSVSYNQAALAGTDITKGRFPVVSLGSILGLVQYGTSEKANTKGRGVPVLRINNIKKRMLDLSDLKQVDLPEKSYNNLLLKDGDILIVRTSGSRDLVGTCAPFHESIPFVFASYLIRLRVVQTKAMPDFVSWFINSALGRSQVDAISRQIMQNNINSQELRTLQIPLPTLDVQRRIMENVEAARVQIARTRETAIETAKHIKADLEAWLLGKKEI